MKVKPRKKIEKAPIVASWNLFEHGVTFSLLSSFLVCPEKTKLGSVENLTMRKGSDKLEFGTISHDALEHVYTGMKSYPAKEVSLKKLEAFLTSRELKDRQKVSESPGDSTIAFHELEENFAFADIVLNGYLNHWKEDHTREWLSLETEFDIQLPVEVDGVIYIIRARGKRDGDYRSRKRKLMLLETKTKSKVNDEVLLDWITIDLQSLLYLWAMWKTYKEVPGGVLYNIIRRPQLVQRKGRETKEGRTGAETLKQFTDRVREDIAKRPEFYFVRYQSSITEADLIRFETELKSMVSQLIRWQLGQFHYKNSAGCMNGGYACKFLPICSRGDRSRFVKREQVFSELSEE